MNRNKSNALNKTLNDFMRLLKLVMIVLFLLFMLSGSIIVNPDEVAVVLRMGKLTGTTALDQIHQPGWLFAFPWPIDTVIRIPIKRIREIKITELAADTSKQDAFSLRTIDPVSEGYLISGDENIFQSTIIVKFQITDPIKAVFSFRGADLVLESMIWDYTVSELGKVAGQYNIDGILSENQKQFAQLTQERVQQLLDEISSGVTIISVEFEELSPPVFLARDFEEVNTAFINRRNYISEANGRREQMLPEARANAERRINQANAYYEEVVSAAEAEAGIFLEQLAAWRKSPEEIRMMMVDKIRKTLYSDQTRLIMFPEEKYFESAIMLSIGDGMSSPADMRYSYD